MVGFLLSSATSRLAKPETAATTGISNDVFVIVVEFPEFPTRVVGVEIDVNSSHRSWPFAAATEN